MIIYRVEQADGRGPFGNPVYIGSFKSFMSPEHPAPCSDKIVDFTEDVHFCAVQSMELFYYWFRDVLHFLSDCYLCEIEIEDELVLLGEK